MRIEVLLATHNGEKFIREFLESLANQNGVEVDLVVSDDNSSDSTIQIVSSFAKSFRSLTILSGPDLGAKSNFAFLIQNSNSDFSAFADQDDIWLENHLRDAVSQLIPHVSTPALVFSKVLEFSESLHDRKWPNIKTNPNLSMLLTENLARGCTIVLNRGLINMLKHSDFTGVYMHDWWAVLVAKTCGVVEFIENPSVRYRIHDGNAIGPSKPIHDRILLFCRNYLVRHEWLPQRQALQLYNQFGAFMTNQNKLLIHTFANLRSQKIRRRYKFLYSQNFVFRQSNLENQLLKLLLLLSPIFERK